MTPDEAKEEHKYNADDMSKNLCYLCNANILLGEFVHRYLRD